MTHINSKIHVFRHSSFGGLIHIFRNIRRIRQYVSLVVFRSDCLLTSNSKRGIDLIDDRRSHICHVGTCLGDIITAMFCDRSFAIYANGIGGYGFAARAIWNAHSRWCNWWREIRRRRIDVRVTVAGVFRCCDFFLIFVQRDILNKLEIPWMFAWRVRCIRFPRRTIRFERCES